MFVKHVELKNFRNYEQLSIDFSKTVNLIWGQNAQGKTNILEAIYFCTCARSHRTSKDIELLKFGNDFYEINMTYSDKHLLDADESEDCKNAKDNYFEFESLNIKYTKKHSGNEAKRQIYYNGLLLDKNSQLPGLFHAVIFAPEDLQIIKEGPSVRRRFINIILSQIYPIYYKNLLRYNKILIQRNAILKKMKVNNFQKNAFIHNQDISSFSFEWAELEAWNDYLADCASEIMSARALFIDELQIYAQTFLDTMSDHKETLTLKYKTSLAMTAFNAQDKKQIKEDLLKKLKSDFEDDLLKGSTKSGPHRDELEIFMNSKIAKIYASQGQQRSIVLALKAAELSLIENKTGFQPILLLDDVMSELDIHRRSALIPAFQNAQIFISCTDPNSIDEEWKKILEERKGKSFKVSDAIVQCTNATF